MSDRFHEAVLRVRAEQFLQEKRASARGVDAVTLASLCHAVDCIEDRELFKLASSYSPDNPLEAYIKLGGKMKVAEPPPPKGTSLKEWDKILNKGPKKEAGVGAALGNIAGMGAVGATRMGALGAGIGAIGGGIKGFRQAKQQGQSGLSGALGGAAKGGLKGGLIGGAAGGAAGVGLGAAAKGMKLPDYNILGQIK